MRRVRVVLRHFRPLRGNHFLGRGGGLQEFGQVVYGGEVSDHLSWCFSSFNRKRRPSHGPFRNFHTGSYNYNSSCHYPRGSRPGLEELPDRRHQRSSLYHHLLYASIGPSQLGGVSS